MRAVIQRVMEASVTVSGKSVASIGRGILVLAGFHESDTDEDREYVINKILGARIFNDAAGIMNLSVTDTGGEILLVPQFTLYGDLRKGKRPSYSAAMKPDSAREAFDSFVDRCRSRYAKTRAGVFGADMKVSLVNSGPVTILLDSSRIF
ncbi:MAG: D-tyrosyl-tRNA(Tyr) deacylase [Spirochaetes bacterium RBG_16_49_21]|nr:MAG: D-tyrosyl-tRNA(Tyr) deacylase [Spirochaetes bacterium RBG_16_49_21]